MAHGPRLGLLFLVVTAVGCQNSQKAPLSSLPPLPPPKALADQSNSTPRAAAPADPAGRRDVRTSTPAVPASSTGRAVTPLAADTDASPFGSPTPTANPASFRQGFPNPRPSTPAAPPTSVSVTGLPAPDGLKNPLPPEPTAAPPIPTPQPPGPPAGSGGFPVAAPSSGLVVPEKLGGM